MAKKTSKIPQGQKQNIPKKLKYAGEDYVLLTWDQGKKQYAPKKPTGAWIGAPKTIWIIMNKCFGKSVIKEDVMWDAVANVLGIPKITSALRELLTTFYTVRRPVK